jgi:hypothetical protein
MPPMAEERLSQAAFTVPHCPWCSAEITPGAQMCARCGAALVEPDAAVPGVTAIDTQAISRTTRAVTTVRRSRLLSWISGDFPEDDETPARPGTLGPPPPDVRREMLRLEIEAEYANLKAEAESLNSEAELEARETWQPPADDGSEPIEPVANELRDEAVANELHPKADAEAARATEAEADEPPKDASAG